jgi:hypothetical protein
MLISNDIMRFAIGKESDDPMDMIRMEDLANSYVSQQIFNVLTAQAPTTDYNPEYIRSSGIDIGETIKLDSMDLKNSLAGPVAIAYAETATAAVVNQKGRIDMGDMLRRAISLPEINKTVDAIEGISVLPASPEEYASLVGSKGSKIDFKSLRTLSLFRRCPAIVVIVSLPIDIKLQFSDLEALK